MAAKLALTQRIATKLSPRYKAFWQRPKITTPRHCAGLSRADCPSAAPRASAIRPEQRKRSESALRGGACATMMRAEAKAEDHMKAKARPMPMLRRSIRSLP